MKSIRLHSASSIDPDQIIDCIVMTENVANPACTSKDSVVISIPDAGLEIAKLTNCYLQAFRYAKNHEAASLVLPILGQGKWSLKDSFHALKHALMIHWRSGALDGEIFPDMDLYLLSDNPDTEKEIGELCNSAFSAFLCDLPDWNSKGNRRMWEHLIHVFAEKEVADATEFMEILIAEYDSLTGSDLLAEAADQEMHYVACLDFGGDGGGIVSDMFWKSVCLPILRTRI